MLHFRLLGLVEGAELGAAGLTFARIGLCKDSVLRKKIRIAAIVHMSEPEDA